MDTPRKIAFKLAFSFVLLFIVTFPFPFNMLPDIGSALSPLFSSIANWIGLHLFKIKTPFTAELISDSTGLYLHVFFLLCLSILISFLWTLYDRGKKEYSQLDHWFRVIISYYLALQLFRYGFDKIFKQQFYLPEPNTLFTPLGNISHDLLYWSAIGSSYWYSIFAGLMEVVAAFLLLFARTRFIGAVLAFFVLLNVVAINFSFDISVKVYSCFLLLLAFILMLSGLKKIYAVFIQDKLPTLKIWQPVFKTKAQFLGYAAAKSCVIGLILFESLYGYLKAGNLNADDAPRPFLHGAYNVEAFVRNGDTIPPLLTDKTRLKRIFIHSRGYFITQNMDDGMADYEMEYNEPRHQLLLSGHGLHQAALSYHYDLADSTLHLKGIVNGDSLAIYSKQVDLKKLPLLQPDFHWTVDEYMREK